MQFEFPWALGPADGRYVVRAPGASDASHVIVVATLGAPERRWLRGRRGRGEVAPEPDPTPVATSRVTIIDARPADAAEAERWLAAADQETARDGLGDLGRLVRAHRIAAADPGVPLPHLGQALVARVGVGAGEQVADGRWSEARELPLPGSERRPRRSVALRPQERLAALLGGRSRPLACEELALRARHDLDHGQLREAALELRSAFDAALHELPATPQGARLSERLEQLRELAGEVDGLGDAAIAGVLGPDAGETLERALGRLEAALRARTLIETEG
ncbi:hypothetical protein [Conexibacter arvalis]|uniref:Uncharacterized protein n=1 Tax=Conexibacter arvalis TaxID=912552 RepID=A0A840IEI3_9ACTN|nr:hypothetical protein [Conexibacter arvalis]MBB4662641.1 hypothetical protein [Conexibacter arvalis]